MIQRDARILDNVDRREDERPEKGVQAYIWGLGFPGNDGGIYPISHVFFISHESYESTNVQVTFLSP